MAAGQLDFRPQPVQCARADFERAACVSAAVVVEAIEGRAALSAFCRLMPAIEAAAGSVVGFAARGGCIQQRLDRFSYGSVVACDAPTKAELGIFRHVDESCVGHALERARNRRAELIFSVRSWASEGQR